MKVKGIICALLLMVAGLQSASAQRKAMKVYDGSNFEVFYVGNVDSVTFVTMVGEIQLSQTSVEIEKGETLQLTATVLPEDADEKEVTWESSNSYAATVDENGLVTAKSRGWTNIICRSADGSDVQAVCEVKVNAEIVPGTHEYVDMGFASGTLWATTNLGADTAEEVGFYYAWGETEPKDEYSWATYKWMTPGEAAWQCVTKYTSADNQHEGIWYDENHNFIGDGMTELLPEDDAATVNWGNEWQTPSSAQFQELIDNSDKEEIIGDDNFLVGIVFTSRFNSSSIFLPAAGFIDGVYPEETYSAYYWSRNIQGYCSDYGWFFVNSSMSGSSRRKGMPIRPVRK